MESKTIDFLRLRRLDKFNKDFQIQITIKNKDGSNDLNNSHIRSMNLSLEMLLKQREICIEKIDDVTTMETSIILDNLNYIEKQILKLILFNHGDNVTE